jgi:hypothetical protein
MSLHGIYDRNIAYYKRLRTSPMETGLDPPYWPMSRQIWPYIRQLFILCNIFSLIYIITIRRKYLDQYWFVWRPIHWMKPSNWSIRIHMEMVLPYSHLLVLLQGNINTKLTLDRYILSINSIYDEYHANTLLSLNRLEWTFLFQCHCHSLASLDLENHSLEVHISMERYRIRFIWCVW